MMPPTSFADPVVSACADGGVDDAQSKALTNAMALAGAADPTKGVATIGAAAMLLGYMASEDNAPAEAMKVLLAEFEGNARSVMARYLALAPLNALQPEGMN
ncbi:MAG: hypothetical protein ACK46Q_12790 [Hyphomonas sp.]